MTTVEKVNEIVQVMDYQSGLGLFNTVYVGDRVSSNVVNRLGGKHGTDSVKSLIVKADPELVDEVHDYLISYIRHMRENPIRMEKQDEIMDETATLEQLEGYREELDVRIEQLKAGIVESEKRETIEHCYVKVVCSECEGCGMVTAIGASVFSGPPDEPPCCHCNGSGFSLARNAIVYYLDNVVLRENIRVDLDNIKFDKTTDTFTVGLKEKDEASGP